MDDKRGKKSGEQPCGPGRAAKLGGVRARAAFRRHLLRWFDAEKRELPWRRTRDPWRILVSEIMLQQTTVATVGPRYEEFMRRFPTTAAMAAASEDRVLDAWSGLGYYSRARRLRQVAQKIEELDGTWPDTAEGLQRLPGIGPYTAAAVASIAFDDPAAAIDTNVMRVVARLIGWDKPLESGETKRALGDWANQLLDPRRPGDYNQAMMELGALICKPRDPACGACPVAKWCAARAEGRQNELPFRAKKKKATARQDIAIAVLRRGKGGQPEVLVWRRPSAVVYANMLELPTWRGETSSFEIAAHQGRPYGEAAPWLVETLNVPASALEFGEEPAAEVLHTITRYKVTLQLWPARLVKPLSPRSKSGDLAFQPEWRPLLGDWDLTATPQKKLLKKLRALLSETDSDLFQIPSL